MFARLTSLRVLKTSGATRSREARRLPMSKTSLTIATALVVGGLSIGLIVGRWYVLGREIDGTPGDAVWKVSLVVKGELTAADAAVTIRLAPDFRRQHVSEEQFDSKELSQ